jgi:hypothetical protein
MFGWGALFRLANTMTNILVGLNFNCGPRMGHPIYYYISPLPINMLCNNTEIVIIIPKAVTNSKRHKTATTAGTPQNFIISQHCDQFIMVQSATTNFLFVSPEIDALNSIGHEWIFLTHSSEIS